MKVYQKIIFLLLLQLPCLNQNIVAQDSLSVAKPVKHIFKAEPLRATLLAVALPGLGQIYNRKYWKVPLVYAGFGALVYAIGFNSKEYNIYMKAYQDFTDKIPETQSYINLIKNVDPATYDPVLHPHTYNPSSAAWYRDGMLRQVDYFKKYRDLSYIGIAAWYLFTILDTNVDASLYNYDIKDNIELKVEPVMMSFSGRPEVGLSMKVKF